MDDQRGKSPLLAGLAAARANLIPGVMIQTVMLVLVVAYYRFAPARHALDVLAGWKGQSGYLFTFLVLGFTGGILPEILRVIVFQRGQLGTSNLYDMTFGFPFWGVLGCVTDTFYRCQATWFGSQVSALMLVKKVALDMLVFTPLWGAPVVVYGLAWQRSGFTADVGGLLLAILPYEVLPVLVANWGVWIPAVTIIYSLRCCSRCRSSR